MGADVIPPVLVLGIDAASEVSLLSSSVGTAVVGTYVFGIDVASEGLLCGHSIGTAVVGTAVVAPVLIHSSGVHQLASFLGRGRGGALGTRV